MKHRLLVRFATGGAALVVGLIMAEGLCAWFHGGAHPYLNIFQDDRRYGVVLEPNTTTRLRTRRGRRSEIRTNALGFRGPAATPSEELSILLGDSQVMGLGVDEDETTAGWLRADGRSVLAAAVPSWGPHEFALAAEDLIPRLRPRDLVFFANLANDWPEANVPNAERNTARDGWLSRRRQSAQLESRHEFPGRRWLLSRSQLVFTVRALSRLSKGLSSTDTTLGASAALRMLAHVGALSAPVRGDRSRITASIRRVLDACAGRCRVLVAILPMDVQVESSAWSKYGMAARDLSSLDRLSEDLRQDLHQLGVPVVDLGPVLRAASPGVFLDDDPHLSALGHRAVAAALRAQLDGRPTQKLAEVGP